MSKELGLLTSEKSSIFSDELDLVEYHCFRLFPFFLLTGVTCYCALTVIGLCMKQIPKKQIQKWKTGLIFSCSSSCAFKNGLLNTTGKTKDNVLLLHKTE